MKASSELNGDELVATRPLVAPQAAVWTAFTTPDGVAAFWGGSHATVPPESVVIDLRAGGEFSLDTRATDGRDRRLTFVYVAISEPSELIFDEATSGLRTTVSIRPDGTGSFLTVHQRKLPVELQSEQARQGLASIVDALANYLELDLSGRKTR